MYSVWNSSSLFQQLTNQIPFHYSYWFRILCLIFIQVVQRDVWITKGSKGPEISSVVGRCNQGCNFLKSLNNYFFIISRHSGHTERCLKNRRQQWTRDIVSCWKTQSKMRCFYPAATTNYRRKISHYSNVCIYLSPSSLRLHFSVITIYFHVRNF